jgi:dTDP-D-glucose 4,6-dehydratase
VICHGSNNCAPRQQPEKLIPLCLLNAFNGDSLPGTATAVISGTT